MQLTKTSLSYASSGVDYKGLDTLKRKAQSAGEKTGNRLRRYGCSEVFESRGESAYVWEEKDCYRAMVTEGLGTKNLVADAMRKITGKTYYDAIAQDTVAMIVNDLVAVGASPQVVNAYFAVGNSNWFNDKKRAHDLVSGWANACKLAGAVWGGGETPTLKDIIASESIDLAGSAIGIIKPKKRLLLSDRIRSGDSIILVESSGIHANGLTLARAVSDKLSNGYTTKLPDGSQYGEALLIPTHIYARFVDALFDSGVDLHYIVNITGHGWRKLMRAKGSFTYTIELVPSVPVLFKFIAKHANLSDAEMYGTFNMGAGLAFYVPKGQVDKCITIAKQKKLRAWCAGSIEDGKRQVDIQPNHIVFSSDTLKIRD